MTERTETLESQIERLEEAMGGASAMAATFQTELRGMQESMLYTGREVQNMSRSVGPGLRRAFDGVVFDGMRLSDALRNVVLLGEPIDDPDELWVHELIGATVIDQDGIARGTVTRLLENPASDLLELDSGTLVPVQFVVSHTPNDEIHVDAPVGLFDLDEAASERDQD